MSVSQGTIIILDTGRNVSTADEKDDKSFFEKAKECAARIIERKILSQSKNLVGVIVMGSKLTNNDMAKEYDGAFKYIEVLSELQAPTWKMIRDLPEKPTEKRADWFDALVVASHYYRNGVSGIKIVNKQIILLTNFMRPPACDPDGVEQVLNGFQEEGYEVNVIGPDIYSNEYDNKCTDLIKQFVEVTGGAAETLENINIDLVFHRKRVLNPSQWGADLSIGPNIKIPVSTYVKLKDEPIVKSWQKAVKDPITSTSSKSEAVMKTKEYVNVESGMPVEVTEKLRGYHYGQKIIPFSDCDKTMLYQSGVKGLILYGFTSADNIKWQNLNGDGLAYVFGKKGDKRAQQAIRCLVECLHELKLVGIVRKVHNNNNAPKMHVLMPVIDTNNVCLSMTAICYKEDIKQMSFPSINSKKYKCSKEQVDAFKELINAMDLTKAYDDTFDDTEAFPIGECVSPSAQYILDCIAYRALNPDKPLPKPREEIMTLFKVPPLLEENARKPLEKLKELFTLTKVEVKKRKTKNIPLDIDQFAQNAPLGNLQSDNPGIPDMPKIQMPTKEIVDEIKTISTVNPVEDFKALQNNNKPLSELAVEMIKTIESLIHNNIDGNYSKVLEAMKHLRNEFVKTDPTDYNNWIKKLKSELVEFDKNKVLNLITENQVSFILKEENSISTYEDEFSHEESQMYENDTVPNSTELTISTDVQNMFDD